MKQLVFIFVLFFIFFNFSVGEFCNTTNAVFEDGYCNCIKNFLPPTCSTACTGQFETQYLAVNGTNVPIIEMPRYIPSLKSLAFTLPKTENHLETRILIRPNRMGILNSTTFNISSPCTLMPSPNQRTTVIPNSCAYLSSLKDLELSTCLSYEKGFLTFWDRIVQKIQPIEPDGEVITEIKDVFRNIPLSIYLPKLVSVSSLFTIVLDSSAQSVKIYFGSIQEEFTRVLTYNYYNPQYVEAKVVYKTRTSAGFLLNYLNSSPIVSSFSEIGSRTIEYANEKPFFVQLWAMKTNIYSNTDSIEVDMKHNFQILKCSPETASNPDCKADVYSQVTATHLMRSGPLGWSVSIDAAATGSLSFHGADFAAIKTTYTSSDIIYGKVAVSVKSTSGGQNLKIKSLKMTNLNFSNIKTFNSTLLSPTLVVYEGVSSAGAEAGFKFHILSPDTLGFSFNAKKAFGGDFGSLNAYASVLIEYSDNLFSGRTIELNIARAVSDPTSQMQTEFEGKFNLVPEVVVSGGKVTTRMSTFLLGFITLLMLLV